LSYGCLPVTCLKKYQLADGAFLDDYKKLPSGVQKYINMGMKINQDPLFG